MARRRNVDYTRFGILKENLPDLQTHIGPFNPVEPVLVRKQIDINNGAPQHSDPAVMVEGDFSVLVEGVAEVVGHCIHFHIALTSAGDRNIKLPARVLWKVFAEKGKVFQELGDKERFVRVPIEPLKSLSDDFVEFKVKDLQADVVTGSVVQVMWKVCLEWYHEEDIDGDADSGSKKSILVLHHMADMMDTLFDKHF